VWFRIPTTSAPGKGSGLPSITHWPGLIASIVAKSRVLVDGNTSLRTADFLLKSDVKSAQQAPQRSITRYEYHLRPLGMFSQTDELVNDTEDLLPWAAGSDLLGGSKGWEHMGQEGTRVLLEGVVREAAEDTGPLDETAIKDAWKQRWARRMPFREMAEDWNTRAFRLGVALKTGKVRERNDLPLIPGYHQCLDPNR
jgi:hypothetical protein